jgi:uncharacterized membrane protein
MHRVIAALLLMLWPFIASTDSIPPALPALYSVAGVASEDKLNVREAPNGAATVLGTLAADATDLEVIQLSLEGNWAYINLGEQSGWVARRFLIAQHTEVDGYGLPVALTCFGTEPFWSLDFTTDGVKIATPEGAITYPVINATPIRTNVLLNTNGFRFEWMHDDDIVKALILPGLCSDGMSNARYGLHYVDDRMTHTGCCSL